MEVAAAADVQVQIYQDYQPAVGLVDVEQPDIVQPRGSTHSRHGGQTPPCLHCCMCGVIMGISSSSSQWFNIFCHLVRAGVINRWQPDHPAAVDTLAAPRGLGSASAGGECPVQDLPEPHSWG